MGFGVSPFDADHDDECIESNQETYECQGPVEYRHPLSPTGESFPRCEFHWERRLDREEKLRRDFPDTPHAPAWFDPAYAGESWDE